jgi:hypothetical protein
MHDIDASPSRISSRSCYAVTLTHSNLYERGRPANESLMTPAMAALGHIRDYPRDRGAVKAAAELRHHVCGQVNLAKPK